MRHVASVFEPTYIVMDASDDDIILMVNKKMVGRKKNINIGNGNGNKMMIASSLEEDDENNINADNDYNDNNTTLISTMLELEKQVLQYYFQSTIPSLF
jgi:hypothetical protein